MASLAIRRPVPTGMSHHDRVSSPSVSIVIPHYGDPGPTRALVARLVPQGAPIVVVDDASPEPLGDVAGAVVIRRARNGGFGAAVNAGVAVVTTDLVAILNSDLTVDDDFLARWIEAAEPWQPAVVAPRVVTTGHAGATTFRFPGPGTVLAQRVNLVAARRHHRWASDLIGEDRPASPEDTCEVDWVSGAAMLIPTGELRAAGGFDERFHMYMEEVDLQRRLRARGLRAVYVGHVRVEHAGFGSSDPASRERWALESWLRYADKWGWDGRLRLALVTARGVNLMSDGLRRVLGRDVRPLDDWRRRRSLEKQVWADHGRRAL